MNLYNTSPRLMLLMSWITESLITMEVLAQNEFKDQISNDVV